MLGARDLPLERGGDAGELALPPSRSLTAPRFRLALDLGERLPRRRRPLACPSPLCELAERNRRIVEAGERLVRQAGDRRAGLGRGDSGLGSERRCGAQPLSLDRRVRREHERPLPEPANDLHPEQRLARARRRHDVRPATPLAPVQLERVERELLVPAPLALEFELQ